MRAPGHGDLVACACALYEVPEAERAALADALIARAHAADALRKRTGRAHRDWGNGTLMAAALARTCRREPPLSDPAYRRCLIAALEALERRAAEGAALNRTRRRRRG